MELLQSAMDSYYKLRQLFYYKVQHGLLQIATGITKCDDYYKLRQYKGYKFIPYNEVSISYVLLLFIIGVKKIVLYIEDFVQLKFHCKCLSFTVPYPPRQAGVIKR